MKLSLHYCVEREFPRNTVSFVRNIFRKVKISSHYQWAANELLASSWI